MVWGLFLVILWSDIRQGFNTHMIATYETYDECKEAVYDLYSAHDEALQDIDSRPLFQKSFYNCAPIPKQ